MFNEEIIIFTEISAEEISELCFSKFKTLPKTGKPNSNEWTILAGVVMYNKQSGKKQVVSLGCGTKCIGKSKLCPWGLILNDSHAEVMARRGLLRYLYYQLNQAISGDNSIFEWMTEKKKFQLKPEISLHFFSTQTPCGDACIIANPEYNESVNEPLQKKSKVDCVGKDCNNVGSAINLVYTGAKLLGDYHSDAMEQSLGAVRTKPGRGERTLSMSCSDKLARWQVMGVQGALLDFLLINPIYFVTLNFWGSNKISSLERAIWKRFECKQNENSKYKLHVPLIRICNEPDFEHSQNIVKQPSPNGLVWCELPNDVRPYEISVNGKKLGVTAKKQKTFHSALKISKFLLLKEFVNVISLKPDLLRDKQNLVLKTYSDYKFLAKDYQNAWSYLKLHYFKQWIEKPKHFLNFSIEEVEHMSR